MSRRNQNLKMLSNANYNLLSTNNFSTSSSSGSGSGGSTFRCRSFCLGVIVASLTWIGSMYLYLSLASSSEISLFTAERQSNLISSSSYIPLKELSRRAKLFSHFNKTITDAPSSGVWKLKFKNIIEQGLMFKKSDKLLLEKKPERPDLKSKILNIDTDNSINAILSMNENIGLVRTVEEKKLKADGFKTHAFNALISSRLEYNRSIPDTRHDKCSSIEYSSSLPNASIIICFYNEEFQVLIRSIKSVLDRAINTQNIHEILLIDDYSDLPNLHAQVQDYIQANFPKKVKLFKTPRREGLIRARIFASRQATGQALVFLDSHIEANINWLEPLLARLKDDRTIIATPIIDLINPDTFVYSSSPLVRGGFNWGLHFKWDNVPRALLMHGEDFVKPILSATMAGGLFAINREYFIEMGEYDEGMDIWGGENIEMSFRIWMCGGRIEIIPCSRIGHVFRRRRPYGSLNGEDTILRNSIRVAEVWMDEFKENFYKTRPNAKTLPYGYGNIQSRIKLREKLGCKPFKWYLDTIYPQILTEDTNTNSNNNGDKSSSKNLTQIKPWNLRKRNYISRFQINLVNTKLCIESSKTVSSKNSGIILGVCESWNKKQRWSETDKHELVLAELLCLDGGDNNKLRLAKCHEMLGSQEWRRSGEKSTAIYNVAAGQCLAALDSNGTKKFSVGTKLTMEICSEFSPTMTFDLINYQAL